MHPMKCLSAVLLSLAVLHGPGPSESREVDYPSFANPPVSFRSSPFWSLNDRLEPAEMARQLEAFKKGGYGGAYLHSRIGLLTGYLGPDWWKAMDAGVEACGRLGLEAWFYDEDRWPSGFAGGTVPRLSEDYHARILFRIDKSEPVPENGILLTEDDQYKYVCVKASLGDPRFNGTCWVDLLNPETVKAFIDCSYRPYAERYRAVLGTVAPGIFTDEPQIPTRFPGLLFRSRGQVGYSPVLRDRFMKEHGYDVIDRIAGLFENVGDYPRVRLDYFRTISKAFEESFSRQIGEYCAEAGMVFTGHFMGEDNFESVMQYVGNAMIQYRHMQRPGIDFLGLRIADGLNTARSLSSVANQYGLERRLSELFGTSGQNMNFEDRLWIANWHAVLGINHFCPHLALYTMKGCRKRDYPPTLSPQQPYWSHNPDVENAMTRISYLTTCGTYAPEFLVLHPIESAYIDRAWGESQRRSSRYADFNRVLETLQQCHRDYDLGDEQILAEIGSVEGNRLVVGKMRYQAVILPFMATIRRSTFDLLRRFYDNGGVVLVVGEFPKYMDGATNEQVLSEAEQNVPVTLVESLPSEMSKILPPAVRVEGENAESVWIHRRIEGDGQIVQLANTSRLDGADVRVRLSGNTDLPVVWDPVSGTCLSINPEADGSFALRLAEAQSLVLTAGSPSRKVSVSGTYEKPKPSTTVFSLTGPWKGRPKDPNAITLDFASYSTDGGRTFGNPEPVIGIHERLASKKHSGPLELHYAVTADFPPKACALVLEQPELFTGISINGRSFVFQDQGFYIDRTFRKSDITSLLRSGSNVIALTLNYKAPVPGDSDPVLRYGTEIESIYLIGDFGVEAVQSKAPPDSTQRNKSKVLVPRPVYRFSSFRLTGVKNEFKGNATLEGYPFYAGGFDLECTFDMNVLDKTKKYFLTFPSSECIVITGELNGKKLGSVAWSPWEMELTRSIKRGQNTLKLTLTNSLRNLLGPHHHRDGELIRLSPGSFGGGEPNWFDLRLTGAARIWRDDYHHIAFGFLEPPVVVVR